MAQHQLTPPEVGWVDKRRTSDDANAKGSVGRSHATDILFDATAAGTTTTLVGTLPTVDDNTRMAKIGDQFRLYVTSTGALKEETVFTITDIESDATNTTVTFSPAAATATAGTDDARQVTTNDLSSNDRLDARLKAIDSAYYTDAQLDKMTQNDKVFALRVHDDPGSFELNQKFLR